MYVNGDISTFISFSIFNKTGGIKFEILLTVETCWVCILFLYLGWFTELWCVHFCFPSSHQDSDGAFEAARGGRSRGWNWGSSPNRDGDQRHLCTGSALQQRLVHRVHLCVCVGFKGFFANKTGPGAVVLYLLLLR